MVDAIDVRHRTQEEFEALAVARRKAVRSGEVRRSPAPPATRRIPVVTKHAERCPKQNEGWIGLLRDGLSLAKVVSSADVPAEVKEHRDGKCAVCPYMSVVDGKRFCGCCGCPAWNVGKVGSDLGYKNGKAGWACAGPHKAFDQWVG